MSDPSSVAAAVAADDNEQYDEIPRGPGVLKRYQVMQPSGLNRRRLEITRDGSPSLWAMGKIHFFKATMIKVHAESDKGPVISATKLPVMSTRCEVVLGDPDGPGVQQYTKVAHDSIWKTAWSFDAVNGKHMTFKSTHNKALGGSRWSADDFKLVDPAEPEKVLMTFIHKRSWKWSKKVGYFDFYADLGDELELQAVTSMIGILYRIEQSQQGSAAASASAASSAGVAAAVVAT